MNPFRLLRNYTLEENLFISLMIFMIILCPVSIMSNIYLDYPFNVNYKWFATLTIDLIALIFSLKRIWVTAVKLTVFLFIIYFILPIAWFLSGNLDTFTIAYFFLSTIIVNYLFTGKTRWFLSISLIILFLALLFWSHLNSKPFPTVSPRLRYQDTFIEVPITLLGSTILLSIFSNAFRRERTKLKEYSEILERLTKTDDLTGLYNRRYLFSLLEKYKENNQSVSVILLDIDNFKQINDTFGHEAGDKAIKRFSDCLNEVVRDNGIVGRYAGDEFLVILEKMEGYEINSFIERLLNSIQSLTINDHIRISASGGMAVFDGNKTINEVLAHADQLLYHVKNSGKNNISTNWKPRDPIK